MKKFTLNLKLTLLVVFAFASLNISAEDFSASNSDGVTIYYNIVSTTDKTVEVTYHGDSYDSYNEYNGSVNIPSEVEYNGTTYSVTKIGNYAFRSCSGLTSITIPNSVTEIGSSAFYGCSGLTSITIPNSVTEIGNYAFNGCTKISTLIIEDGEGVLSLGRNYVSFDSIGEGLFYDCPIETLYLGRDLTYNSSRGSGYSPFYGKTSLKYLTIGNSVTSIGSYAFNGCSGLTSITIPNSVTSIGSSAFSSCSGLTSITIPNSVTKIGSSAFWNCSGLTSITIPNSVTEIGNYAFNGCTKISTLIIEDGEGVFLGWNYDRDASIGEGLFYDCPIETLYLGRDLTYNSSQRFGYSPFYGKTSLKYLTIGNSVTSIGSYAFNGCSGLTSITIPNSVTSIGSSAFSSCRGLTSITIPNSVTSIGNDAFYGCFGLTSVTIPNSVTSIGNNAFCLCTGLTSITIPNSVTSIGSSAFKDCTGLTSITIPNSVTSIGSSAFKNSITDFLFFEGSIPPILDSYDIIDESCFFIIPDEAYDAYCAEYSGVVSRIIPYSKHNQVVNITASDNTSALLTAIGEENTQFVVRLKITGSINSYDLMVMNNKMTNLRYLDLSEARVVANPYEFYSGVCTANDVWPQYAFYQKTTLREVLLPESVHSIGSYAFYNCTSLTSITIPNSVTSIGSYAFNNCRGLTSITIPNSVTSIGNNAFYNCYSLTSITIPNSVNSIGSNAFSNCSWLSKVTIGNSVTSIGNYAFNGCSRLKKIKIPSSVLTVGSLAFSSCQLDTVYTYTIEPTSIGQETFSCYETAVLAVPEQAYYNYYWDTQWSQFTEIIEFNEPYDNFYLQGDYTSDDNTGRIDGNPDVTQYENSGYIVEGNEMQSTGDLEIKHDGTHGGSVIANNNLSADSLCFCINITANKWYFFSFPFDVNLRKCITYPGNFVFRYYDGDERAQHGHGGWKNVEGHHLHAGHGYIFQGDQSGKLILSWKDIIFKGENKRDTLHQHQSNNSYDKSWNFVGNPHCSYYGIKDMNYNAPITVWNGSTYVAYNPTDDDYYLHPFQAFFVQCPEDVEGIDFDKEHRKTKNGAEKAQIQKLAMNKAATQIDVDRQLINITISGDSLTDRTRIVFNNQKSMDYEMECDAAKFISTEAPQIYSLDTKDVKYAINERPLSAGTVDLGYSVSQAGVYKIAAPRMDCEVELEDKESGAEFNLTLGDYEFTSEAGTFENRFVLRIVNAVTKVETTFAEAGVKVLSTPEGILIEGAEQNDVRIYDVRGQLLQTVDTSDLIRLPKAIYIVRVGQQSTKVVVK